MKSLAVMQPYFFPYIGYFQLIHASDVFVFYDDVDFIKNGWINRNRILINGQASYLTIPCKNASSNKHINSVEHILNDKSRNKLLKKIRFTYQNAPQFDAIFPIIEKVIMTDTKLISEIAIQSVKQVVEYLNLECKFYTSSDIENDKNASAVDRLIDLCSVAEADRYLNPIGGEELYKKEYFAEKGIMLDFLEHGDVQYKQFKNEYIPDLSIIDVLMFNSKESIKSDHLNSYSLS